MAITIMILMMMMMKTLIVESKLPVASDNVSEPLMRQFVGDNTQCLEPEVMSLEGKDSLRIKLL